MVQMTIEEAKARIRIPDLWRILGLPGDCSKNPCHSPLYEHAEKPSFSVSAEGDLFNDFRTGHKGDAVTFLQLATGLSSKEACRKFLGIAGGQPITPLPVIRKTPAPAQARELPPLPSMREGSPVEHAALAALRNVSAQACRIAGAAGLLRFGEWKGRAAWFITEPGGRNAQARRMDGQPWPEIGAKAQTLPGCWASWPIGAGVGDYETILFCEGGPDLLAALHFIVIEGRACDCFPVAMLGAGQRIHSAALPLLAGKRIRIYADADEPGREAARRWKAQLVAVRCRVDAVDFSGLRKADGSPVKDLNDATEIHPDDAGELKGILPE